MKQLPAWIAVVIATTCLAAVLGAQQKSPDWPQWRGPQRTGEATLAVPAAWPAALKKRWEIPAGAGYSSPVVAGNRVVLHTRQRDREVVRAVDRKSVV